MLPVQPKTFLVGTIKTRRLPLSRRVEARPSRSFEARVRPQLRTSAIPPLPLDVRQVVGDEFGFEVINLQLRRWGAIRLNNFREIGSKTAAITANQPKLLRGGYLDSVRARFSQTQFYRRRALRKQTVIPPQAVMVPGSRSFAHRKDFMAKRPTLTTDSGMPVSDNQNSITAGPRGPVLMQDFFLFEKLAHQNTERLPERGQHP